MILRRTRLNAFWRTLTGSNVVGASRVVRVALRAAVDAARGIPRIDRTGFFASPGARGYIFCPKMGICGTNVRKYTYSIVHLLHYYYNGVRTAPLAVSSPRRRSPDPQSGIPALDDRADLGVHSAEQAIIMLKPLPVWATDHFSFLPNCNFTALFHQLRDRGGVAYSLA